MTMQPEAAIRHTACLTHEPPADHLDRWAIVQDLIRLGFQTEPGMGLSGEVVTTIKRPYQSYKMQGGRTMYIQYETPVSTSKGLSSASDHLRV